MFQVVLLLHVMVAIVHSDIGTDVVFDCGANEVSESETGSGCSNTLYILSLLPYPDDNPALQPSWDEGPSLFLAEQLAVEHINNRDDILQNYHLELVQGDSGCNIKSKAVLAFVEHVLAGGKKIAGTVGPGCSTSAAVVLPLSGREEIALINVHIAGSVFLTDREKYPYSFGTLDSTERFVDTLIGLMKKNSWYQVATLYDESQVYCYSTLEQKLRDLPDYSVAFSSVVYNTHIQMSELEQAHLRVIFLLVGPDFLGKIFCLAFHNDFLYPDYQWVIVGRTLDEISRETEFEHEGKHYSCTEDELKKAADGNVIIHYELAPFNTSKTTDTGLSYNEVLSAYEKNIERYNGELNTSLTPSFWTPAFYDAVWSLAFALNNSIETLNKLNLSLANYMFGQKHITDVIKEQIEQTVRFEGMSGMIKFNSQTGYVDRVVSIYQINNGRLDQVAYYNTNATLKMSEMGTFIGSTSQEILLTASLPLAIILLLFTFIGLLMLIASQVLSVFYRDSRSVKASSPRLNHLAYAGCFLIVVATVSSVIFLSFKLPGRTHCAMRQLLNSSAYIGTTLQASVILVKTWRLYRILVHFRNPGRLISDKVLFTFVLFLTSTCVVINILWITLDPFFPETMVTSEDGVNIVVRELCPSKYYFVWLGTLCAFNLTILLLSLLLAGLLHRVHRPTKDFKTTPLILLVYIGTLLYMIGLCVYFLCPPEVVNLMLASLGSTFISTIYLSLIFLFLPPIIPILKQKWLHR